MSCEIRLVRCQDPNDTLGTPRLSLIPEMWLLSTKPTRPSFAATILLLTSESVFTGSVPAMLSTQHHLFLCR